MLYEIPIIITMKTQKMHKRKLGMNQSMSPQKKKKINITQKRAARKEKRDRIITRLTEDN